MKQPHVYISVGALVIGLGIGYMLWGTMPAQDTVRTHGMSDDTAMTETMNSMTSGLSGKTGDAFDQAFLAEMIVHHEGAVAMANQVLATSRRPELIKLAHDIITAQTAEIGMMREWQSAWFK